VEVASGSIPLFQIASEASRSGHDGIWKHLHELNLRRDAAGEVDADRVQNLADRPPARRKLFVRRRRALRFRRNARTELW
jgi:hypothetical protein